MISLIFAVSNNGIIGRENDLPWPRIKDDMDFFREHTTGKKIVMGRKTWESLPGELPNRKHYICTRDGNYCAPETCTMVNDINVFLEEIKNSDEEYCVIGGANLMLDVFEYTDKIYLTKLDNDYDGDIEFPFHLIDEKEWEVKELRRFSQSEENASGGIIFEYKRIR